MELGDTPRSVKGARQTQWYPGVRIARGAFARWPARAREPGVIVWIGIRARLPGLGLVLFKQRERLRSQAATIGDRSRDWANRLTALCQ